MACKETNGERFVNLGKVNSPSSSSGGNSTTTTGAGGRSRAVAFRMLTEASTPVRSVSELERTLRRRLRIMSAIVGVATGALGILAAIIRRDGVRADPMTLFTEPPLPGVLIIVALVFA